MKEPSKRRQGQLKVRVKVYLSEAENKMLNKQAQKRGLAASAYVRTLIQEEVFKGKIGTKKTLDFFKRHLI